ncbi:MAG TPA: hypothetical protein VMU87_19960 [Stellaceae bacterium]|nr:hypothetical protein [Stellaceae bacterium]
MGASDRPIWRPSASLTVALGVMRTLTRALDPDDTMNPGKILQL